MRHRELLCIPFLVACSGSPEFTEAVRSQVEQEVEEAQMALLTGPVADADIEAIARSFLDDGLYVDGGVAHASYAAYRDAYVPNWNMSRMDPSEITIRVAAMDANNAVSYSHYRLRQFDQDGQLLWDAYSPLMTIWTRRNGEWRPHSYYQDGYSPVDGVWAYLPPYSGGTIYRAGHFVHAGGSSDDPGVLTINVSGTYRVDGDTVHNVVMGHSDSAQLGSQFKWTYEFQGDTVVFQVIAEGGEVIETGRAVRVAR